MTQDDSTDQGGRLAETADARPAVPAAASEDGKTPAVPPQARHIGRAGKWILTTAGAALIAAGIQFYVDDIKAERAEKARQAELLREQEAEALRRKEEAEQRAKEAAQRAAEREEERQRAEQLVAATQSTAKLLEKLASTPGPVGPALVAPPLVTLPAPAPISPAPASPAPVSPAPVATPAEANSPAPAAPAAAAPAAAAPVAESRDLTRVAVRPPPVDLLGQGTARTAPPPAVTPAPTPAPTPKAAPAPPPAGGAEPVRSFTVLGGGSFSLCGQANFTAETSTSGVLLVNTNRAFVHRTGFRLWEKRVPLGTRDEVFPGCIATFEQQSHFGSSSLLVREYETDTGR